MKISIDLVGRDPGALDRRLDGLGAQIGRLDP
jgi:hypothetical protein